MMEKLIIIIPAYNEEKRIENTLKEYSKFFGEKERKKEIKYRILVVINNSKDKTEEIVKNYKKRNKKIDYLNFKQGGKGFAIIEGFREALKDRDSSLIGFVDADMATSPEAFYDLAKNIDDFEGIIASRYVKGAVVKPKQSLQRIIVSRVFNFLVRSLFFMKYKDTQCGAKLFKRKAIESIINSLGMTQWSFDVDLLYQLKKRNISVKEYPTIWADKEYSKVNFMKAGPRMALSAVRLRIINSVFEPLLRAIRIIAKFVERFI
jgi:glycosyltransferase involved in cell wall biosynthesis